ncbi:unnamed protein product [Mycena citricolor]|uniref:Uncharacterized protein n=1 Tax=Mycena citricolor TaxID=2018698 RepID=A0AAD2Q4Y2_9AGAR|nr:unnamed protein product [Mycena citricolor]
MVIVTLYVLACPISSSHQFDSDANHFHLVRIKALISATWNTRTLRTLSRQTSMPKLPLFPLSRTQLPYHLADSPEKLASLQASHTKQMRRKEIRTIRKESLLLARLICEDNASEAPPAQPLSKALLGPPEPVQNTKLISRNAAEERQLARPHVRQRPSIGLRTDHYLPSRTTYPAYLPALSKSPSTSSSSMRDTSSMSPERMDTPHLGVSMVQDSRYTRAGAPRQRSTPASSLIPRHQRSRDEDEDWRRLLRARDVPGIPSRELQFRRESLEMGTGGISSTRFSPRLRKLAAVPDLTDPPDVWRDPASARFKTKPLSTTDNSDIART